MMFECVKRGQKKRTDRVLSEKIGSVFLPMPANLSTEHTAKYSQEALGALGHAGIGAGSALAAFAAGPSVKGAGDLLNLAAKGTKAVTPAILLQAAGDTASAAVGGAKAGAIGSVLGAGAAQAVKGAIYGQGFALNPHLAQLFTGVDFRQHTFSFKLVAKSTKDSQEIRKIISFFRQKMLPRYRSVMGGNAVNFFDYPDEWEIRFRKPQFLFNLKRSVLISFKINYHGENRPFYHEDESPVSVTIDMTFAETEVLTADDPALSEPVVAESVFEDEASQAVASRPGKPVPNTGGIAKQKVFSISS
jgi:hypothetical protein